MMSGTTAAISGMAGLMPRAPHVKPGPKPRRKKTSRMLKSDENFMYATFKLKPKGGKLTPRKPRRRRGSALASTAAAAETLANRKKKRERMTEEELANAGSRSYGHVWKFHEQYAGGDGGRDMPTGIPDDGMMVSPVDHDGFLERGNGSDASLKSPKDELKAECCVTCGHLFQKNFWDPQVCCESCRSQTRSLINSSKLFSLSAETFQDSSPLSASSAPSVFNISPSVATSSTMSHAGSLTPISEQQCSTTPSGHLFCSLCRHEFSTIPEYLTHIQEHHHEQLQQLQAAKPAAESAMAGVNPDNNGKKLKLATSSPSSSSSKTKKSLSHKTLTCPVEECPMFFRLQRDLDSHLAKKHDINVGSQISTLPYGGVVNLTPAATGCLDQSEHHHNNNNNTDSDLISAASPVAMATTTPPRDSPVTTATTEKPLQCPLCDYRCRQRNALAWHMRKHPEVTAGHRPFK